jgi:hypothetical protein
LQVLAVSVGEVSAERINRACGAAMESITMARPVKSADIALFAGQTSQT